MTDLSYELETIITAIRSNPSDLGDEIIQIILEFAKAYKRLSPKARQIVLEEIRKKSDGSQDLTP